MGAGALSGCQAIDGEHRIFNIHISMTTAILNFNELALIFDGIFSENFLDNYVKGFFIRYALFVQFADQTSRSTISIMIRINTIYIYDLNTSISELPIFLL